jgi:aryl-alcohol dehydrogenase-like predicted oxidoreductase
VVLTKAYLPVEEDVPGTYGASSLVDVPRCTNRNGLSRVVLFEQVEASLERLQTRYIDVLQIHRLDDTPFIEVMKALHDLVESGKARYVGVSSMWAHEFAQMQAIAEVRG